MPDERPFSDAAAIALERLEARLNARREAISRELCSIPPPVPACDVNFNALLEERGRVVDALQALGRLRAARASVEEIVSFCEASPALDAQARSEVQALLRERGGASAAPTGAAAPRP